MKRATITFTDTEVALLMMCVQKQKSANQVVGEDINNLLKKLVNKYMEMGD